MASPVDPSDSVVGYSILIVNPNTSVHMTEALEPVVESLRYTDIRFDYFTAPTTPTVGPQGYEVQGLPSINGGEDSAQSALHCFPYLKPLLAHYDAFLVACYSAHPLVAMLKKEIGLQALHTQTTSGQSGPRRKHVTGIFEASVSSCLALTRNFTLGQGTGLERSISSSTFGIVSTGSVWEDELSRGVKKFLLGDSGPQSSAFAGVSTTGLTAMELHTTPAEHVKTRITEATVKLINGSQNPVAAICLGCAGMTGMDAAVREGCVRALGPIEGAQVIIVDGLIAGVGTLVNACKAGF